MVGVTSDQVRTGEVWLVDFDPVVGHEQGGVRPAVIMSSDGLHSIPIRIAVVVPLTRVDRGLLTQPRVASPGCGLNRPSFARAEDVRSIDLLRVRRRLGQVTSEEFAEIQKVLRYFLDL